MIRLVLLTLVSILQVLSPPDTYCKTADTSEKEQANTAISPNAFG